jgi:lambda family phage portal protein
VNGVEFDAIGRRVAYWLFSEHPGSRLQGSGQSSRRVPAEGVLHVYRQDRPGQVRGPSWFAPVILKLKDWDEYDDAQLVKQKVAALLAVVVSNPTGETAVGTPDPNNPTWSELSPGAMIQAPSGTTVDVVAPPRVGEFGVYAGVTLHTIAAGLDISYEDLTGDYSQVNYSSARMARLRHDAKIQDWRWRMLIPQLCTPVWNWVFDMATIAGEFRGLLPAVQWTPPPLPFLEPDKEGLAIMRNIRAGITTLSESLRERGYDPQQHLQEMADDNALLDALKLILDSDPRRMTQAGQAQSTASTTPAPTPPGEGQGGQP